MPVIRITNSGQEIEGMMLRSLLVTLLINDIPIKTHCGGKALCGKCAVRVIHGAASLSSRNEREKRRLRAIGADEKTRLACQCFPGKDVEIEIINCKG